MSRADLQERQYVFPYHYIPYVDSAGRAHRARYLNWGYEYLCYQRHIRALVEELQPESIVEIGCGDGCLIGSFSASKRRLGVDISSQAIAFARAFNPDMEFRAVDAGTVREVFDVVLTVEVLEHIPDHGIEGFVKTIERLAAPGGALVISVPSCAVPLNRKHYRHYTAENLTAQILEHAPSVRLESLQHVFAPPKWFALLMRATCNRFITIDAPFMNSLIWRYVWRRARIGSASRGRHIVAVFRKDLSACTSPCE